MSETDWGAAPMAELRRRRPDLFEAPPFWRSTLADIDEAVRAARRGRVDVIGRSAGGRPIRAFSYGEFEPQQPTATISSAMASDRPEAFFDPARRTRPALLLIGCIHGGETEGIASALNVIEILETGRDLLGEPQAAIAELVGRCRLVIVPCLNVDGRERAAVRHLNRAEVEHIFLVQQGVTADGVLLRGRKVKETHPLDPSGMRFLGGYYNDAGVNLQHDDFFGPQLAPENAAVRDLVRRELPDGFLTFHAHGGYPGFTPAEAFLSPGCQRRQAEVMFYVLSRLAERFGRVYDPGECTGPPWSFCFQTFLHHASGALPLLFEHPHGIASCWYSLSDILRLGLLVVAAWTEFALRFGLRPKAMEFYNPVRPA